MRSAQSLAERRTLKQVADLLDVHSGTVRRWTIHGVRGKRLPSFLIGGRRYVTSVDLAEFLEPTGGASDCSVAESGCEK